jgi:hypothetical protein
MSRHRRPPKLRHAVFILFLVISAVAVVFVTALAGMHL